MLPWILHSSKCAAPSTFIFLSDSQSQIRWSHSNCSWAIQMRCTSAHFFLSCLYNPLLRWCLKFRRCLTPAKQGIALFPPLPHWGSLRSLRSLKHALQILFYPIQPSVPEIMSSKLLCEVSIGGHLFLVTAKKNTKNKAILGRTTLQNDYKFDC
jgi:hypothetical protein